MSLYRSIPDYIVPLGVENSETKTVNISTPWYKFLLNQYLQTIGTGIGTADAALLESAEIDQGPIVAFNPTPGAQTATFTASNKPGTGTTTPDTWITVYIGGVAHYIPAWK